MGIASSKRAKDDHERLELLWQIVESLSMSLTKAEERIKALEQSKTLTLKKPRD